MPAENNFLHSKYSRSDPGDRVAYREFNPGPMLGTPDWQNAMAQIGATLNRAGVRTVLFVYGTYVGTDVFGSARLDEVGGIKRGYSRGIPGLESLLALLRPQTNGLSSLEGGYNPPYENDEKTLSWLDSHTGDCGNFSAEYLKLFEQAINQSSPGSISCRRYLWASCHHHLGRAQAACRLIERLRSFRDELSLNPNDRILVFAHGHAGQVFALLSNLLFQGESLGRQDVVGILQAHCGDGGIPGCSIEQLQSLGQPLISEPFLQGVLLDVVTFGTPIRYGWETSSLASLLHIVNHRPLRADAKRWLAKMDLPQTAWEMPAALGGDYVQQLAVAGTDAVPPSPEDQAVNHELRQLLEPYDGFERWLECARRATRCANDGQCLLVDYQDGGTSDLRDHLFGHACYTKKKAMLFNLFEVVNGLYPEFGPPGSPTLSS